MYVSALFYVTYGFFFIFVIYVCLALLYYSPIVISNTSLYLTHTFKGYIYIYIYIYIEFLSTPRVVFFSDVFSFRDQYCKMQMLQLKQQILQNASLINDRSKYNMVPNRPDHLFPGPGGNNMAANSPDNPSSIHCFLNDDLD